MKTEVIMKRELFGCEISQQSKTNFFSATELVKAGDQHRKQLGLKEFQFYQYLKNKSTIDFIEELEKKYNIKVIVSTKGRNGQTWVHPLLFIDIALAISPTLKIEVYEWLFDNLILFRNDSGDSYKEMTASVFTRIGNVRDFQKTIQTIALDIKKALYVTDWQTATEEQLKKRDNIHLSIKTLCRVLTDIKVITRIAIEENKK